MTSRHFRWPEMTRKWRHLTGSHQEVAVEGQKLPYTVPFNLYKAVPRKRRQSCDRKWRHMTSGDRKWRWSDSLKRKSPKSCSTGPKPHVYCTFHLLQCCSLQEEAVTCQEMMSREFKWPEATRNWRHLTGTHLEVAVEGQKLAYTVISLFTRL